MSSSEGEKSLICSSRKRRRSRIASSEDEEVKLLPTVQTPPRDNTNTSSTELNVEIGLRSSERITRRRNRSFTMPSRDDIWKDIPSSKSPIKVIRELQPRKLVNNYTKENNRYNYDPVYTSGEESRSDFINDDTDTSCDNTRRLQHHPTKSKHRIRHRRTRVSVQSDTSSDTDREPAVTKHAKYESDENTTGNAGSVEKDSGKDAEEFMTREWNNGRTNYEDQKLESDSVCDGGRASGQRRISSSRRVAGLLQDSESDSGLGTRRKEVFGKMGSRTKQSVSSGESENDLSFTRVNRSNIIDSDVELCDSPGGEINSPMVSCDDLPCTSTQDNTANDKKTNSKMKKRLRRSVDSDSNSESESGSNCDVEEPKSSRNRVRMEKKRKEKQTLFETFRQTREKRLAKLRKD